MTYEYKRYQGYAESNPEKKVTFEAMGERGAILKARSLLMHMGVVPFGTDKKLIKVEEIR
jgi:hypothetical protein